MSTPKVFFGLSFSENIMLSKSDRLAESVIKSVLEMLKNHPDVDFSELQIEQGTREKVIAKQVCITIHSCNFYS